MGRAVCFNHDFRAVCSNFIALLRPAKHHDPWYLTYLLQALYENGGSVPHIKQTTGIQNLDCASYLNNWFSFPNTDEQIRIARSLTEETEQIDRLIGLRRRQIQLLQQQRAAIIQEASTRGIDPQVEFRETGLPWLGSIPKRWRVSRLKHLCSHIVDCLHSTPIYREDGEYPAIRTADVTPGRINTNGAKRVNRDGYLVQVQRLVPQVGDIVYSREGERFGIAACVPPNIELCVSQRMMHFRSAHGVNGRYLMWQLTGQSFELRHK